MQIYSSLRDRLKNQHLALEEIVKGTSREQKRFNPAPGKWSIHDHLTHLAKYQPVFLERLNLILNSNKPEFSPYKAENDSEFETWRSWKGGDIYERLKLDREKIFQFITSLSEEEFSRTGVHKKYGELTIVEWSEFFLLHEAHHVFAVFQLAKDVSLRSL